MGLKRRVSIDRAPAEVYAHMLAALREESSAEAEVSMRDIRVGSIVTTAARSPGPERLTVTRLEPVRLFGFRFSVGSFEYNTQWSLEAEGRGTRLTLTGEVRLRGAARILSPALGLTRRRFIQDSEVELPVSSEHWNGAGEGG